MPSPPGTTIQPPTPGATPKPPIPGTAGQPNSAPQTPPPGPQRPIGAKSSRRPSHATPRRSHLRLVPPIPPRQATPPTPRRPQLRLVPPPIDDPPIES
jgi:hypothetical protein